MPLVRRFTDAAEFRRQVTPFLSWREAGNSLPFRIIGSLASKPAPVPPTTYLAVCYADDRPEAVVFGVALRTPPHNLVLSSPFPEAAMAAILADTAGMVLPGVIGPAPEAEAFARAWQDQTHGTAEVTMRLGTYVLEQVAELPSMAGQLRAALPADEPLAHAWVQAFHAEALAHMPPVNGPVDLEGYYFWEVDGLPVTSTRARPATPQGSVINDVYTPPALRRRGYATAAVAAASLRMLAEGSRLCFLFTDLANPTSNGIYQRIGYRYLEEFRQIRFTSAGST